MNWSEWEFIWRRQELPRGADADLAELRLAFDAQHRRLARALMVRDFSEGGAGLVVVAFYGWFWHTVGPSGWPMAIAIGLVLGVSSFFIRERIRERCNRLPADAPLIAKVAGDLSELRRQCRLVRNLWSWYLAPCGAAIAIQMAVIVRQTPPWDPLREPLILGGFGAFFAGVFWFAWVINRRTVRKRLEPRMQELEKLYRDLTS